jgi:hypothetical protein
VATAEAVAAVFKNVLREGEFIGMMRGSSSGVASMEK